MADGERSEPLAAQSAAPPKPPAATHEDIRVDLADSRLSAAEEHALSDDPFDRHAALIVRGTVLALGGLGLFRVARSLRLFARYNRAAEVPDEVVRTGVRLSGTLEGLTKDAGMHVYHRPMFNPAIVNWFRRPALPLTLRLCACELSDDGREWLWQRFKRERVHPTVWFRPVRLDREDPAGVIDCEVFLKRHRFVPLKYSVNAEVVRRGLARVPDANDEAHLFAMRTLPWYARLVDALVTAEQTADSRGVGMWRRPSLYERARDAPAALKPAVVESSPYKAAQVAYNAAKYGVGGTVVLASNAKQAVATTAKSAKGAYEHWSPTGRAAWQKTRSAAVWTAPKAKKGTVFVFIWAYYLLGALYRFIAVVLGFFARLAKRLTRK